MDELLVFKNDELDKLHLRIQQLQQKLNNLRNKLKGLHKETVNLKKDKITKKTRVSFLENSFYYYSKHESIKFKRTNCIKKYFKNNIIFN